MNMLKKLWEKWVGIWSAVCSKLKKAIISKKNKEIVEKQKFRLFAEVKEDDLDFISDSKSALLNRSTPLAGVILYTIFALIIISIIWAYFASIDQMTIGEGKVIPSSEVKVIQSLDGGIIQSINVEEGELIKKDQILLEFDDTRYKSDYEQGREKYFALTAAIARLKAETQGLEKVNFPTELEEEHSDLIHTETKLFEARRLALEQELNVLQKNYDLAKGVVKMYEPLLKSGVVPKIDYYRAEQASNEIQRNILTLKDKSVIFRKDVA